MPRKSEDLKGLDTKSINVMKHPQQIEENN